MAKQRTAMAPLGERPVARLVQLDLGVAAARIEVAAGHHEGAACFAK
jgi:hypothetical protein